MSTEFKQTSEQPKRPERVKNCPSADTIQFGCEVEFIHSRRRAAAIC
jgi:hypothetical protein